MCSRGPRVPAGPGRRQLIGRARRSGQWQVGRLLLTPVRCNDTRRAVLGSARSYSPPPRRPYTPTVRYVAVAVLAAAGALAAPARPLARSSGLRACAASQLNLHVVRYMVGLSHTGGRIAFTNSGQLSRRVRGWPNVVGITRSGAAGFARHVRSTWYGPYGRHAKTIPALTLKPGQSAVAAFAGSDLPAPGENDCAISFRYLRVTPPGANSRPVVLSAWFPPLARYLPACWPLEVSMVVRPSAFGS